MSTTTFKTADAVWATIGGVTHEAPFNSTMRRPTEHSGEDDASRPPQRISFSLAPGEAGIIWDGTRTGNIRDYAVLAFLADGPLKLSWLCDTPESEDDLTASGDNEKHIPASSSCVKAFSDDNPRIYLHATNATIVGVESDNSPTLWTTGAEAADALYKKYQLWAKNPSTTDTVTGDGIVAQ